jgi:hypothetical protein
MSSFNLKDLIDPALLEQYQSELSQGDGKIDEKVEEKPPSEALTEEMIRQNKEALRKRIHDKKMELKNKRLGKVSRQNNQIEQLRQNPLFQNLGQEVDMKKMIDAYASKMTTESKQKKHIKKQMEKLMEQMKDP